MWLSGAAADFANPVGRMFEAWGWMRLDDANGEVHSLKRPEQVTIAQEAPPYTTWRLSKRIDKPGGWCSILGDVQKDWSSVKGITFTGEPKGALRLLLCRVRATALATLREQHESNEEEVVHEQVEDVRP